jgi:hypothetical protein
MAATRLYLNTDTGRFVISPYAPAPIVAPLMAFRGATEDLTISLCRLPSGQPANAALEFINIASVSLEIYLGAVGATAVASQTSFTKNATNTIFSGQLNYATAQLDALFSPTTLAYVELNLQFRQSEGGYTRTILDEVIRVKNVTNAPATLTDLSGDLAATRNWVMAAFVKFMNDAGATVTLKSPDGTHTRTLGVNDDGTGQDDIT